MKYLMLILLFLGSINLNCQTVNDIPIIELKEEYVRIVASTSIFEKDYKVLLDYGQSDLGFEKGSRILDKEGNQVKFNTIVSALNFMYSLGFELIEMDRIEHVNYFILQNNNN